MPPPQLCVDSCYDAGNDPILAAVEAGRVEIEDHLTYFQHQLAKASRTTPPDITRLPIGDFVALYRKNQHQHGHHFVIHQHNHPGAGVHYDLRLQFSATSSVSWAFPKGLPGNPNSRQLGRMAVETRVHNLWNNLIESASMKTGSLLIWDTGTFSVLPRKKVEKEMFTLQTTDDESDEDAGEYLPSATVGARTRSSSRLSNRGTSCCVSTGPAYQKTTPSHYACRPTTTFW